MKLLSQSRGILVFLAIVTVGYVLNSFRKGENLNLRSKKYLMSQPLKGYLPTFRLVSVEKELGIEFKHEDPVLDPIFGDKTRIFFPTGAGAAVADFNNDGWMDVLLINSRKGLKNKLYINQNGNHFTDQADAWGISDTNLEGANVSAIVLDYNNDGKSDVYLARLGCSQLFKNTGSRFENVSEKSGIMDCKNSVSAVPLDYDGDGNLDLYVLRYWPEHNYFKLDTPYVAPENFMNAMNGGKNTLYRNLGNGKFADVTAQTGGADSHWSLDGAAFYVGGKLGLLISNDFGPDTFYAIDNKKLTFQKHYQGTPDRRPGMGTTIGDLTGDGTPNIYVSNAFLDHYQLPGNFLWRFQPDGKAADEAVNKGVQKCGWSWGALFSDLDLDGKEDLYVANGFITTSRENEDTDYEDLLDQEIYDKQKDYRFSNGIMMSLPGIVARDIRLWPSLKGKSMAGHEMDCVFINKGDEFIETAAAVGVPTEWDGRAVAAIDYDNNGTTDLLITTQDGPAHLLKNEHWSDKNWITFRLQGVKSNRDGAGAVLRVTQGKSSQYRWATAGKSGFLASSDPRIHFGLSRNENVNLEIRWPSGTVQRMRGLSINRNHVIVEKDVKQ